MQITNLLSSPCLNKTCVFKSPTGSGKTIIMAKFIEEIIKTSAEDLCFLWVSIGKGDIHKQSKKNR